MRRKAILFLLLLCLLLSACGGTGPVADSFAGRVEGSEAFIAIVTNGERVLAYFCNGQPGAEVTLYGWFRGELDGNVFDLTDESGDRLIGEIDSNGARGTVTPVGGSALAFEAGPVGEPFGLYRVEGTFDGVEYIGGEIVLPNGERRGATRGGNQFVSSYIELNLPGAGKLTPQFIDPLDDL